MTLLKLYDRSYVNASGSTPRVRLHVSSQSQSDRVSDRTNSARPTCQAAITGRAERRHRERETAGRYCRRRGSGRLVSHSSWHSLHPGHRQPHATARHGDDPSVLCDHSGRGFQGIRQLLLVIYMATARNGRKKRGVLYNGQRDGAFRHLRYRTAKRPGSPSF